MSLADFPDCPASATPLIERRRPSRWISRARVWLGLTIVLLAGTASLLGQETRATLGGKVYDPQQAVVPGATVTVTAEDTGMQRTTTTNETGNWRVQFLVPGRYHFAVSAAGFKVTTQEDVQLQIADQKYIDVTLAVGATNESIEIKATIPLIDTTAAVSGTVIATEHLQELPSQTNSPTLLVGLTPGAYTGLGTGSSVAHLWGNAGNSNIAVNGGAALPSSQSGWATNYQLDGAADGNAGGQVAFVPPLDAVSEFRVVTNAYDASIGRSTGATINMSLKSGSETFHGTLYEFNQNNFLNANYFQNNSSNTPVPLVHTNEFGGQIGGPVLLPKLNGRKRGTYFFFNYENIRNKTPGSTGYMSIPTMKERQGDFTDSFTTITTNGVTTKYPLQIYNPFSADASGNRTAFPGNVLPASLISNSIVGKLLTMLPAPDSAGDGANSDSNNYLKRTVQDDQFGSYAGRVDQNWSNAHHSYASLRWNKMAELSYDPFGPGNLLQGLWQHRINKGMTLDHTWVVSPTKVLDFRYSVTTWDGSSNNTGAGADPTKYGISQSFAAQQTLASIPLLTGLVTGAETGGLGTNQYSYTNDRFQDFTVTLTQVHGNHTFHYGGQFMVQQRGAGDLGQSGGSFAFDTKWTVPNPLTSSNAYQGSAMASALLGLPTSGSLPVNTTGFWSQHYWAVYFQDDWRVTDKLTINVGLRWDVQRPASERDDRFWSEFNPYQNLAPITAVAQPAYGALIAGTSTNTGVQLLQQYRGTVSSFNALGGLVFAGQNGASANQENTKYKYFQPRVGFAYRLSGNTVVRGGVGRFVQASFNTGNQLGFSASTTFQATTDSYITPASTLSNPFPSGLTPATGNSLGILTRPGDVSSFNSRDIGRAYVDEASVHVQHQWKDILFEAGGVLDKSHNLVVGYNINLPSTAAWQAAYGPTFDSAGRPADTKPGDVVVNNPFKGAPYIVNGTQNNSTISAYQLLRPNPLRGDITENLPYGKSTFYALQTKIERRFKNGFNLLQSFSWGKTMSQDSFLGNVPQTVTQALARQLDPNDRRFLYALNAMYELPFGRGKRFGGNVGKGLNRLVGGWEISGIESFSSGTPISLPTNSSFFKGGDPSISNKSAQQWFDTSLFSPYPGKSTTVAQLQAYPSWTGVQNLPGYNYVPTASDLSKGVYNGVYQDFTTYVQRNATYFGNVRNPFTTDLTLGVRKNIQITERVRLQFRMDAFNALNHPRFGSIDTTPSDKYFGYVNGSTKLSQVNAPRAIQLAGKLYF